MKFECFTIFFFFRKLLDNYFILLEKTGQDFWWVHDVQKLTSNTPHRSENIQKGLVCLCLFI